MVIRRVQLLVIGLVLAGQLHAADEHPAIDIAAEDRRLQLQREAFRDVFPAVELGNWQPAAEHAALLEDYVLWPDLRATWFRATLENASHDDVASFLQTYGLLKPARELRYRFALHLAEEGHYADFLDIYRQFYQGLDVAKLDCIALDAEIRSGRSDRIVSRGLALWQTGQSQAEECDPVFSHLKSRGLIDESQYQKRYALAIDAQQISLARNIARSLGADYQADAAAWQRAASDPQQFIATANSSNDTPETHRRLAFAAKRIAYRDPLEAAAAWRDVQAGFAVDAEISADVLRYIALWAARRHLPDARALLDNLDAAATNTETGRWQVRSALRARDWTAVAQSIDALPDAERKKPEWRYWQAVALQQTGRAELARDTFKDLAAGRGYYEFLAADEIGSDYKLVEEKLVADDDVLAGVAALTSIVRARELFHVGQEGRGRSEWDTAVRALSPAQREQAALLADRWGWHSRAIATVAGVGKYDDLELRYPLPWRDAFEQHAAAAGIDNSWAYGIARSESLFMRDIRSSAGAIGLMQLMPGTGRQTARELNLPYRGLATLTDSQDNIRLGTHYLGKMHARFANNPVLATAAYNAGPHRVDEWLPDRGSIDARIWIENIPFNETRAYVKRVLSDEVIFQWRLNQAPSRLTARLAPVAAPGEANVVRSSD